MKKSTGINPETLRKSTRRFGGKPLALAIAALTLASCTQKEKVLFVKDANDCDAKTSMTIEQCKAAYQSALTAAKDTAPKYKSERECETDFGNGQCLRYNSDLFMPVMAGFMVSQLISDRSGLYQHNPGFLYRNRYNPHREKIVTADGRVLGNPNASSYNVSKSALKPKPKVTRTVSRGGFGSTAAAKSNWGGGKSRGGWGG